MTPLHCHIGVSGSALTVLITFKVELCSISTILASWPMTPLHCHIGVSDSAVTVFKPKPKTAGNRNCNFLAAVTVFLEFRKRLSGPITKVHNNNVFTGHAGPLPPPSEVTIWRSEVQSLYSLITGHNGLMSCCGHQLN